MASAPFNPAGPLMALLQAASAQPQQPYNGPMSPDAAPMAPQSQPMPQSAQQSVLPASSPVTGPADINNVLAINKGLSESPGIAGPNAALDATRQKIMDLQNQRGAMQTPQTAPHNLALRILSATAPGRAISNAVYGPGVNQYNTQRQSIADQISALQDQAGISHEQLQSGTSLAGTAGNVLYKGAGLEEKAQHDRATEAAATAKTAAYVNWHNTMGGIMQSGLNIRDKANQIRQQLGLMNVNVQQDRNKVIMSLGNNRITLDADKYNAGIANGDQGIINQIEQGLDIKQFFGVENPAGDTSALPLQPGGQQPFSGKAKTAPNSTTKPKPKAGVIVVKPEDMK